MQHNGETKMSVNVTWYCVYWVWGFSSCKVCAERQSLVRLQFSKCDLFRAEMSGYVFPDCVWECVVTVPTTVERWERRTPGCRCRKPRRQLLRRSPHESITSHAFRSWYGLLYSETRRHDTFCNFVITSGCSTLNWFGFKVAMNNFRKHYLCMMLWTLRGCNGQVC